MINFYNNNLLEESLDKYAEHLAKQNKSHAVISNYLNPNKQFVKFLGLCGITSFKKVTQKTVKSFQMYLLEERDFTQGTVDTFRKHLRMFFDFLVAKEILKENIVKKVKQVKKQQIPSKQLKHFYTFEEILRRYQGYKKKNVSYGYLKTINLHIKGFIRYLVANEIGSFYSVSESTLLKYAQYLWEEYVNAHEGALVVKSQINRLRCIVKLFRYLHKEGILKDNPTININWEEYYQDITEKAKKITFEPKKDKDLTAFEKLKIEFLDYERAIGKSKSTINHYNKGVDIFCAFLDEKGIQNLFQVTERTMHSFFMHMCNYIGDRGKPISNTHKNHIIYAVKLFFRYLVKQDFLDKDPSLDIESFKETRGLPHNYMNEKEVFDIIDKPLLSNDPLSVRDKAILEVLFSTAIRCNELCSLDIEHIDFHQGMLRVNKPKGGVNYQRVIPIGETALKFIDIYLDRARPELENHDTSALFLSYSGNRIQNEAVLNIVKKYAFQCGFRKNITTHSFRVTCATSMFNNGASIRHVQDQLGHQNITSTQIYTRLAPVDLKSVHTKFHPRERRKSKIEA